MKKRILGMAISLILLGCMVLFCACSYGNTYAASAPSVEIEMQGQEIIKEKGQKTFDVKDLFTINTGSYNIDQLSIAYSLKKDDTILEHDDLVFDYVNGNYTLTVLIVGNGVNIGMPVMTIVDFILTSKAPSFANEEDMLNEKKLTMQKNQGFFDLSVLYEVIGNSYDTDEWKITYDAKYPGREVEVFGNFIKAITGIYTVTTTIVSVDGAFEDVQSIPMTIIVQKARPSVAFEYETESGKQVIYEEHTIPVYSATQYIDFTEYFTIYGNAYVDNEYKFSLIVKKDNGEDGYENCQVFDGMIAPKIGKYEVVVKVNPMMQGAFTPIISETIIFNVQKAVPYPIYKDTEYVSTNKIDLSNLIPISNSYFALTDYTISYAFQKGDKTIYADGGNVKLNNGEWAVTSTITAKDGQFEDQIANFVLVVEAPISVLAIILISVGGSVLVLGAIAVFVILRVKKNKRTMDNESDAKVEIQTEGKEE